jgi:hypothetical protein
MAALVWVMVGLALWHFTVFLPDNFYGGIVGAFCGALLGSVIFGNSWWSLPPAQGEVTAQRCFAAHTAQRRSPVPVSEVRRSLSAGPKAPARAK